MGNVSMIISMHVIVSMIITIQSQDWLSETLRNIVNLASADIGDIFLEGQHKH